MTWLGLLLTPLVVLAVVLALAHVWVPLGVLVALHLCWVLTRRPEGGIKQPQRPSLRSTCSRPHPVYDPFVDRFR